MSSIDNIFWNVAGILLEIHLFESNKIGLINLNQSDYICLKWLHTDCKNDNILIN